jgi:5-methylthioadenosine/S-adenosylhomocysteine deaminase
MDHEYSLKEYGMTPACFFDNKGVLGEGTTIAHCVHMEDSEIELLSRRRVRVALCPASNMRLRSGNAPVKRMMEKGVRLSVGLDSPAINDGYDIFADTRLLGIANGIDAKGLLPMLFDNNDIVPGADADLIFLDSKDAFPTSDLSEHICLSVNSRSVTHVMVDGKFVVLNRQMATLDEAEVIEKANDAHDSVCSRLELG